MSILTIGWFISFAGLERHATQLSGNAADARPKTLDSSFRWNDDLEDFALNAVVPAQAGIQGLSSHCRTQSWLTSIH